MPRVLHPDTELLIYLFAGDSILPPSPSLALAVRLCELLEPRGVTDLIETVLGDPHADGYLAECLEWGFDVWCRRH